MSKVLYGLLWILAFAAPGAWAAEKVPQYVGARGCKNCHKKELIGDQYGKWLDGKHAKAFETLKSQKALDIAKERNLPVPPHESADCVKCHATSHGLEPAQIKKKPLVVKDGIQCESCHGPGSLYKKKKTMSDRDKSLAAGLWEPEKDEKICTACHNADSPTWDDVAGFDYEKAKEEIAHPIPEDVKGKYVEVEKARKKAGGEEDDDDEEED